MEPSLQRIAALVELLGDPQRGYPIVHLTGTNGKTLHRADGRRAADRDRAAHRPLHQPAPAAGHRADQRRPPADHAGALRRGLPGRAAVRRAGGRAATAALSKFEVLTAMGFAAFADAPVEAGIVEVGLGGRWDATNVADGDGRGDHPDRRWTTPSTWAPTCWASPGRRPGSSSPARSRCWPRRTGRWPRCCWSAASRWTRRWPGTGSEFGVVEREIAVGGQRIALRGLGGLVDEIFLPLHGEHQAGNAALALAAAEALIGAGPQQPIDPDAIRAGVRRGRLARAAGAAGRRGRGAHRAGRRRAQPARRARPGRRADQRVPLQPAGRGARRDGRQGRRAASCAELEPVLAEVIVTANSSPRAMDPDELGRAGRGGVRGRPGQRRASAGRGRRAGRRAGRGGRRVRRRCDRHRLGGHRRGGPDPVREAAAT